MGYVRRILLWLSRSDRLGFVMLRIAIAVVFLWVGALKFTPEGAEGIVPFVANSPLLSGLYKHPDQYRAHLSEPGERVASTVAWHRNNGTYAVADCLGAIDVVIGLLFLAGLIFSRLGTIGASLAVLASLVTLSFLLSTPEAWVPPPGDRLNGFPYLSDVGRSVLKDAVVLAGSFALLVQSLRASRR